MPEVYDIVIKNARTRDQLNKTVNIGIKNGKIREISERSIERGEAEINADKNLVTESFVDTHLHMDKVFTLQKIGEKALQLYQDEEGGMGEAMSAIEVASHVKDEYDESWIYENAKKAIKLGIKHGVLHHRVFVDTDTKAELEGIKALLKLKDEFEGRVNLNVVAFPQDGILKDPGSEELVREAIEKGADTVGGIPWIEHTDDEAKKHIDKMFDIATEYSRDIAMLTDDAGDPSLRTTEMLAVKTIKEGWQGRTTACHARAMETYPTPYFNRLSALLKRAKMSIVSDPQTGPLHAKIRKLTKKGVNVSLGQDDIADAYYPYGQNSMVEVAFIVSHLTWATTRSEMEMLYDMITKNGAKDMKIKDYGVKEGCKANLVILNTKNIYETIRTQDTPAQVISDGKIIAENKTETEFHLN